VEVRHQWPPDLRPAPSGHLAVIQPWEFGAVPSDWVEQIRQNVDELWVPSEFVRRMYLDSGVDSERVHVVPNGVDLERFTPEGPKLDLDGVPAEGVRFLFVGGMIPRKGPDLLLRAWLEAFDGREDVTLIVKDFGATGVYARGDRSDLREHVEAGRLPRIVHLEDELDDDEMAALYRSAHVLVHPYRGEGFGMPVLEAMACGIPVVVTGGGPTDEFCPEGAGWRIPSERVTLGENKVGHFRTTQAPWLLEPDVASLVALLREAASDPDGRAARGRVAAEAARALSWDAVAARYRARLEAIRDRPSRLAETGTTELQFEEEVDVRVLAAPAWRAEDDGIAELLSAWAEATSPADSACLYLLASTQADGKPEAVLEQVSAAVARAGIDLESAADVTILVPPFGADDDATMHRGVDAYVSLHGGADGHIREALCAGNGVLEPSAESITGWLRGVSNIRRAA
jgi:glycosyltransferase involved in cell wall biosynthesis